MKDYDSELIAGKLNEIPDPHTARPLSDGAVIRISGGPDTGLFITVELAYPAASWSDQLCRLIRDKLADTVDPGTVEIEVTSKILSRSVQGGLKPLKEIRNVIAVASGKGGVGKSTVTVNLALALAAEGARIGVLDADIYGPSQPRMLGISGQPQSVDGKSIEPMENHGVQAMSIGFLIDEETPMIWRGPMVTQALDQLLNETRWRDLDYLIIDLPPGTGDTQLSLAQKVPVTGAVVVTTPQDIALLDARKAVKMFEKVDIEVFGVIENMSTHVCSQCGHEEHIFGSGGGRAMAEQYKVAHLGDIPLDIKIRADADGGKPTVVADSEHPVSMSFRSIARRVAALASLRKKNLDSSIPDIVVNKSS